MKLPVTRLMGPSSGGGEQQASLAIRSFTLSPTALQTKVRQFYGLQARFWTTYGGAHYVQEQKLISRQEHTNYLQTLNNICIQDYVDKSETAGPCVATGGSSHLILPHTKIFVPVPALRAYRGSRGLVPFSLNTLNPELNPICYLLALLGAHHFLHVSRIRVKLLTFRLLMSYIYMEHPFLTFLDHTQRRSTVGRTPLDE